MAAVNDNALGADAPAEPATALITPATASATTASATTAATAATEAPPINLSRRGLAAPDTSAAPGQRDQVRWVLALSAEERTRLRGLRHSRCGRPLVLQLPRGEPLQPGEWLGSDDGPALVQVEAAAEALLLVRAADPLELLRAAYHLGNRHVALEVKAGELRLLADPVLADLLRQRGLWLEAQLAPFLPEGGAYAAAGHGHGQGHSHSHAHSQAPGQVQAPQASLTCESAGGEPHGSA